MGDFEDFKMGAAAVVIGGGIFTIIILAIMSITVVPAGHVGVWDLFGNVRAEEIQPGFHIVNPLASVHKMSYRTQDYTMSIISEEGQVQGRSDTIRALTKEGLTVDLDITLLFKLQPDKADEIYKTVGEDYVNIVVRPQIRSTIREVVAKYDAKTIYSEDRTRVEQDIYDILSEKLFTRGIIIEDVLLRTVALPDKLSDAIEQKLTAEQEIQKKTFEVQREIQEAERKRVEARGIADANEIIAKSLTTEYLTWYWIDNLDQYDSIAYVPVGNSGLPVFKEV